MLLCTGYANAQSIASFRVQDMTVAVGQEVEIPVIVDNPLEFNGLQLSVTLPEGLTFVPYENAKTANRVKWAKLNAERCEDSHAIASGKTPKNNKLTFVAYSSQNDPFVGKTGEILKFKVKITEDAVPGVYYVTMDNMEFSDIQNKSIEQDAMAIKITVVESSGTTGVETVNAADDGGNAIYNIQGQRVAKSTCGLLVKNNRKYIKE